MEAEIREERKLFVAFRNQRQVSRACAKLNFDMEATQTTAQEPMGSAVLGKQLGVNVMDIAIPGGEVSKRRLIGSDAGRGTEKIRVIQANGSRGGVSQPMAEVAHALSNEYLMFQLSWVG